MMNWTDPQGSSAVYDYQWEDGSIAFKVVRFDTGNGHDKKRFQQWCLDGQTWVPKQLIFSGKRPLLNLPALIDYPTDKVLVVEGEKKAYAADARLADAGWIVTAWSGGAQATKHTDWTALRGREVWFWPDNDQPGWKAADDLRILLPNLKVVDVPFSFPDGWDLADEPPEGWDWAKIFSLLGANPKDLEQPIEPKSLRGQPIGLLTLYREADALQAIARNYYLKGILSPGELSVFYGEPGCGKSFLALYIARALSQGRSIFGRRVHQTNVLFLALEGIAGFEKRIRADIARHPQTDALGYISQPINLFSNAPAKEAVIKAASVMQAGLIVIDTLNRAMGEGSENDPSDMGQFIQNLDAIKAATKAHVMVIHHSGKDSSRGMRGHSSLLGATDVAIEVEKTGDAVKIATIRKAKDDADGVVLPFALDVHFFPDDEDGDPVTTCVVRELEDNTAKPKPPLSNLEMSFYRQICELFATENQFPVLKPLREMPVAIPCATRDQIREWCKTRGLIGVSESVAYSFKLNSTDRNKLMRVLNGLRDKGKIGIQDDWIWLINSSPSHSVA